MRKGSYEKENLILLDPGSVSGGSFSALRRRAVHAPQTARRRAVRVMSLSNERLPSSAAGLVRTTRLFAALVLRFIIVDCNIIVYKRSL